MVRHAFAILVVLGCKSGDKPEDKKPVVEPTKAAADAAAPEAPAAGSGQEATPKQVEAAPPPKLLDKPVERRLYSDRIESSSFLWTDWNKFQENYHPNYILDGDPKTAWVEGADSSGAGEWVRIHISPVESATKIRVKIQNGYHKSKELYGKNARLKQVDVIALPSGTKQTATLKDAMEWQEVTVTQPAGKLEAIELRAAAVYEGSKYTDLCVSDVELYVTGLTAENPAFEKSKLDSLLAWKKKRIEAAKTLGSAKAAELPILAGYRLAKGPKLDVAILRDSKSYPLLRAVLADLGKHATAAPAYADAAKRATAALESDFSGWVRADAVAKAPIALPEVDGLREADGEDFLMGASEDAMLLPTTSSTGVLVRSSHLSVFDTKGKNPIHESRCKPGTNAFMRPPRKPDEGPTTRELLVTRCISEETREGMATFMTWQLLEFDADGNLVLTAGPHEEVQWFEWQKKELGPVLVGGGRLLDSGDELQTLAPSPKVAKK